MNSSTRLAGIAVLAVLAAFTGAKLIKMSKVRGYFGGPAPVTKTITDKATQPSRHEEAYWLAWDGDDIQISSRNRINLPKEAWETFSVGDPIEVLYFPNDPSPYHRKDVFSSDGNFIFDGVVFAASLSGFGVLLTLQIRHVLSGRGHRSASHRRRR